mmetsp:Transcript_19434/g.56410  ORF Transcript_19434/g.56410 Transcript_19434/m.56410 type:complete len:535 (-) Transcript_19434:1463-3067(-)
MGPRRLPQERLELARQHRRDDFDHRLRELGLGRLPEDDADPARVQAVAGHLQEREPEGCRADDLRLRARPRHARGGLVALPPHFCAGLPVLPERQVLPLPRQLRPGAPARHRRPEDAALRGPDSAGRQQPPRHLEHRGGIPERGMEPHLQHLGHELLRHRLPDLEQGHRRHAHLHRPLRPDGVRRDGAPVLALPGALRQHRGATACGQVPRGHLEAADAGRAAGHGLHGGHEAGAGHALRRQHRGQRRLAAIRRLGCQLPADLLPAGGFCRRPGFLPVKLPQGAGVLRRGLQARPSLAGRREPQPRVQFVPQRVRGGLRVPRLLRAAHQGRGALPRAGRHLVARPEPELRQHFQLAAHAVRDLDNRGLGRRDVLGCRLHGHIRAAQARQPAVALGALLRLLHLLHDHVPHQPECRYHRGALLRAAEETNADDRQAGAVGQVPAEPGRHLLHHDEPPRAAAAEAESLQPSYAQVFRARHHGSHRVQHAAHGAEDLPRASRVVERRAVGHELLLLRCLLTRGLLEDFRAPQELLQG